MESRFTPLLSTNYVPSNAEMDEIHNLLADPVNQLTQIDTKIARLQDTIDQLSLQQTQLRIYIASHKALTTPMRRIPEEILQEIFIHCLPAHHNAIMSSREAPLVLGRVCSQWRSVSRATPRLWSSIHIAVITEIQPWTGNDPQIPLEIYNGDLYIEVVQAWLNRSGDLPLAISIFYPTRHHSLEFDERLISCLMQFSHRWRNISFAMSSSLSSLSSLSRGAVPLLESFIVRSIMHDYSPTFNTSGSFDIFLAPRLQVVSSSHMRMIPQGMDWSRLASLSLGAHGQGLEELTPIIALDILRKSPNLVHCKLEFGWNDTVPFDNNDVVTMPLLETLSIGEGASILNPFFERLRLPSLINLEFLAAPRGPVLGGPLTPDYPSICVLLARIDSLRELTLSSNNVLPTTLMQCLKYTPYIIRLSILTPARLDWYSGRPPPRDLAHAFNDEVLVALLTPQIPGNNRSLLCPRLKVIECNPGGVSDAVLLTFIQQRTSHALTHGVEQLERVDIKFRRQQEVDILSVLPSDILAETQVALDYYIPPVLHRNPSPRAGLEGARRLEIPTAISRFYET